MVAAFSTSLACATISDILSLWQRVSVTAICYLEQAWPGKGRKGGGLLGLHQGPELEHRSLEFIQTHEAKAFHRWTSCPILT